MIATKRVLALSTDAVTTTHHTHGGRDVPFDQVTIAPLTTRLHFGLGFNPLLAYFGRLHRSVSIGNGDELGRKW